MSPVVFHPGLRPNDPTKQRMFLRDFLTGAAITPPPAANWDRAVKTWGMMGNDSAGDCFWADCGHSIVVWTANNGTEVDPSTVDILRAYSEATGYNANDPSTDQGTVMQDGLSYWRKTGIPVGGTRHKIVAFAQVDHTNAAELEAAVALFGAVHMGINFPGSAMDQFNNGQPWDVVPGAKIEGGHAIVCARYDSTAHTPWTIITWGQEQPVTAAFMAKYLEEAWVTISQEWLAANGNAPSGLNLAALGAEFSAITGEPNPFPNPTPTPTPPGPPPFPGALVAAVQSAADDPKLAPLLAGRYTVSGEKAATAHLQAILAAPRR